MVRRSNISKCVIGPGVVIGDGEVKSFSHLENSQIMILIIGPFARLREQKLEKIQKLEILLKLKNLK